MKLSSLKGIGSKTEDLLSKMGINDIRDLMLYFPRDYETFEEPLAISCIEYKTFAAVKGMFMQKPVTRRVGKRTLTTAILYDEFGGKLRIVWFNAPFMVTNINIGDMLTVRGRLSRKTGSLQMDQPKLYNIDEYNEKMKNLQPIYPLIKGITNTQISKAVRQVLDEIKQDEYISDDAIPASIRYRYDICEKSDMITWLHFPKDKNMLNTALKRASFEEIFFFILQMKVHEKKTDDLSGRRICVSHKTEAFLESLPFELTAAQRRVTDEIANDMSSGRVMNRLIQGDVGSGKTIVALAACMNTAFSGAQAAIMAPTEVLAKQHYNTITGLFNKYNIDLKAALLTGSMTMLEKKVVYDALEYGRIDLVVGTHALIQDKVKYKDLALVVTDEQHRFGLKQRQTLCGKGNKPHIIVMSATPIPRTLALIIYGHMDVSVIDEVPISRKKIKNAVIDDSYKENAYKLIIREVRDGHQAYIICPLIEQSEGLNANNAVDYYEMLNDIFPKDIRIGLIHGKMRADQKNKVMSDFSEGRIQVLISTTVVEVGVDVPNATVMLIEDADRFGLAALHQLRGRVGRGDAQGYCIFVSNNRSDNAKKRLDILKNSNNGFEIASKDLALRGPGEFTGLRQSGELAFRFFDPYTDEKIAKDANDAVTAIFANDVRLSDTEKDAMKNIINEDGRLML